MRSVLQLSPRAKRGGARRRFRIVPEDTRFEAHLRPGPPWGINIGGITGDFSAIEGPDGLFDLSQPVEGSFRLEIGDLELGNRFLNAAVRQWLGREPIVGQLGDTAVSADGSHSITLVVTFRGAEHHVAGSSILDPPEGSRAVLHGGARVHPADMGLRLPRRLVPTADLDWAIVLELVG